MKIFSFIFIFYLLFLSWQPCQDLTAKDVSRVTTENSRFIISDETQADDTDDCSPFCVCSCCCASTATAHVGFSIRKSYLVSTQESAAILYRNDYSQQLLNSIWQPPKFNFTA